MVCLLSDADVDAVLELSSLLDVVATALRRQAEGAVERPDRPHFPVGPAAGAGATGPDTEPAATTPEPAGTALVMPAYIHGAAHYATKLVAVHEGNPDRGIPTVNAQVVLTAADTGLPAAVMDGTRITNARTGCLGGLAARSLLDGPVSVGVLGAGTQARWQTRAVAAATDLRSVAVYSPSDSRDRCAADLRAELDAVVEAVSSPTDAVRDANLVVTATTATEPVFPADALRDGTVVVAVGAYTEAMQELDPAVLRRATRRYADVPEEVADTGDAVAADLGGGAFEPFAALLDGPPVGADEVVVVESVGSAVLDAATASLIFDRARDAGVGTTVPLSATGE